MSTQHDAARHIDSHASQHNTSIANHDAGPQNVAAGSGTQHTNNIGGTQYNSNSYYTIHFPKPQDDEPAPTPEEQAACLHSLGFRNIYARQDDIRPAHPGTCGWLFDTAEWKEWKEPSNLQAHNGVLWIKGKPGVGKSTLMKHILLRCKNEYFSDHFIVSYFFNARGDALEKTPLGMVQSIAYQLLQLDSTLFELLLPRFRHNAGLSGQESWQWRQSELTEFVRSAVNQPLSKPLLLLIDALDECSATEVEFVVDLLESISINAALARSPLRVCLSSRHYPTISMKAFLELTVERNSHHYADITKYTESKLRMRDPEIEAQVREKSRGIFLWVIIVVSLLNRAYDNGREEAMRRTLDEVPTSLEEIFQSVLSTQDGLDRAETILMLQWVLLSRVPLTSQELFAAVVGLPRPPLKAIERRITASSKGLIEVRDDQDGSVQFIHQSVGDFLFRKRMLTNLDPELGHDPIKTSHGRLWASCWSCINNITVFSHQPRRMDEMAKDSPFLSYAVRHIFDHANEALAADAEQRVIHADSEHGRILQGPTDSFYLTNIRQWLKQHTQWFPFWKTRYGDRMNLEPRSFNHHTGSPGLLYVLIELECLNLVHAVIQEVDVNVQGGYYGTALQVALSKGYQRTASLLLKEGADVAAQGGYYGSALLAALYKGSEDIAKLLLSKGADVNAQGAYYNNALQLALVKASQETASLILDMGANVHTRGGVFGFALQAASYSGYMAIVKAILEKGADINAQGGLFGNALQAASYRGHLEIVRLLVEGGANVNGPDGLFGSALQAASYGGFQKIVELLLQKGADVDTQGGQYGSALQAAQSKEHYKIVKLLLTWKLGRYPFPGNDDALFYYIVNI